MKATFEKYGDNRYENNNGRYVSVSAEFDKKDNLVYRVYKFDSNDSTENRVSFCKSEKSAKQMVVRFLGINIF